MLLCKYVYTVIECSHPPVVVNGRTSFSGVAAVNSVAVYSCNEGFELVGLPNITCQADATWTMAPICESKSMQLFFCFFSVVE